MNVVAVQDHASLPPKCVRWCGKEKVYLRFHRRLKMQLENFLAQFSHVCEHLYQRECRILSSFLPAIVRAV